MSEVLNIDPEVYAEILRNTDKKNYMVINDRILRKVTVSLVKSGHATFLFLTDDEVREYWEKLVKNAATTVARRKKAREIYEIKINAWNRLSEADRKTLKLRKPAAPRG